MPYRLFLEEVLPSIGLQDFIVKEGPSGDALDDIVGGTAPRQPQWGLPLSQHRMDQLKHGLSKPTLGKGTGSASSQFKMPPQLYREVFTAVDDHVAQQGPSHLKSVPHSQVTAWAKQLAPLYEAHLSSF